MLPYSNKTRQTQGLDTVQATFKAFQDFCRQRYFTRPLQVPYFFEKNIPTI